MLTDFRSNSGTLRMKGINGILPEKQFTRGFKHAFSPVLVVLFISVISLQGISQKSIDTEKLDEYITACMKDWEIPGLAIGIVKDDSVIFAKGYGVRELGKKDKVDVNTMFGIASLSKAFTAACLAVLVDEGRISWDDKVTDYLEYFRLYDPCATHEITVRDLLCHRAGFRTFSGDLLWYTTTYTRREIIERIQYLEPAYSFRSQYGYSNLMFLVAGELIPAISGKSYDEFVQTRIFDPLGMKNSNTSISEHKNYDNVAIPHDKVNGKMTPIIYRSWDNIAPAGGINSTVSDMVKWIKLQLNSGTFNGKELYSSARQKEMWQAHTPQNPPALNKTIHFRAYGLGWGMMDYYGRKVVYHGGACDGMISRIALVPEEKLGFVILTNNINALPAALMYRIIETYMGEKGKKYSDLFLNYYKSREEQQKQKMEKEEAERVKDSSPTLPLKDYTGTYRCRLYGEAKVTYKNKKLIISFVPAPDFTSEMDHWQYNTFRIKFEKYVYLPEGKVTFTINAKGKPDKMFIDVPNPDFHFYELIFEKVE